MGKHTEFCYIYLMSESKEVENFEIEGNKSDGGDSKVSSTSSSSSSTDKSSDELKVVDKSNSFQGSVSDDDFRDYTGNARFPKPQNVVIKPIVYAFAAIGALSGLTFGYDLGGSGATFEMPAFRQYFGWDESCSYLHLYITPKGMQSCPVADDGTYTLCSLYALYGYDIELELVRNEHNNNENYFTNHNIRFSNPIDIDNFHFDVRKYGGFKDLYPKDKDGNTILDPMLDTFDEGETCKQYWYKHRIVPYDVNNSYIDWDKEPLEGENLTSFNKYKHDYMNALGFYKRYYSKRPKDDEAGDFKTGEANNWGGWKGSENVNVKVDDFASAHYIDWMFTGGHSIHPERYLDQQFHDMLSEPCMNCCCDSVKNDSGTDKSTDESSNITLFETLGCMIGALVAGLSADYFGRRIALIISSGVFCLGATLQIVVGFASEDVTIAMIMLYIGRIIGGLGIGMISLQATLYQSEIAPESIRGLLVTFQQLMITTGIVSASLCDLGFQATIIGWRFAYGGNVIISGVMLIALMFCPESPTYLLIIKGNESQARFALEHVRSTAAEVDYEIWAMKQEIRHMDAQGKGDWRELFSTKFRNNIRMGTVASMHALQQLTGINSIMFYGPTIVTEILGRKIGQYGGLIFNSVNFFATFICVYAIDRFGRLPLWLTGTACCATGLLISSVCAFIFENEDEKSNTVGWFIIVGACIFIVGFAYSWGPLAWVYGSEALNPRTKAIGMSLGVGCNWAFTAIIGKTYPYMRDGLGIGGSFLFFLAWVCVGAVVLVFFVPETTGVPLDKMDYLFENMKIEFLGPKMKKQKPENLVNEDDELDAMF